MTRSPNDRNMTSPLIYGDWRDGWKEVPKTRPPNDRNQGRDRIAKARES